MMNKFVTALVLGGGLALGAGQAIAQEGTGMRHIMGWIGLVEPERDPIDYRARAPLVVPPQMRLPEPKDPASGRNANWPNDPDLAARAAASADARLPATQREKYILGQRPLLSQDELRKGRINAPPLNAPPAKSLDDSAYDTVIKPIVIGREIAAQRAAKEDLSNLSRDEPQRRYLSDPPVGYRKPASSAAFGDTGGREAPRPFQKPGQEARDFIMEQARR